MKNITISLWLLVVIMFTHNVRSSTNSPDMNRMNIILSVYEHCDNPKLALAIIKVESNFHNVVSSEGSTGLMQVKPETAKWIKCQAKTQAELLDMNLNIKCGCFYLGKLATRYRALSDVISAYNAGSARKCSTGILYPSGKSCNISKYINQDYVNKVTRNYHE